VASLSQGRTAAAQCGLFTHKSVPVIFEPPCILFLIRMTTMASNFCNIPHRAPSHPDAQWSGGRDGRGVGDLGKPCCSL